MNQPTVYVAQKPDEKKNIVSASKYGDFKFILPEKTNLMWDTETAVSTIKKELRYFNDRDHLLLIGDPAVIGICTAVAADYNQGRVKFLKWDNREYTYYPVEVEI
jgi:hypothetical protein|tara:strand:+ start:399 stop:713 length:315 start_codon:yes stop_codon:yes gene_type:complete